jgi:cystathionine gamma-synthase
MHGGFGAVLSLQLGATDDSARALKVLQQLRLFAKATSFGSTESYAEHRYAVEGAAGGAPANLLRLSIGLEAVEDLIADLDAALQLGGLYEAR